MASDLGEVLLFSRGFKSDRKFCPPEKTTWYVYGRVNSRLRFYVAATLVELLIRGKLAEWLWPVISVRYSSLVEVSNPIASSVPSRRPHGTLMVELIRDCDSMWRRR